MSEQAAPTREPYLSTSQQTLLRVFEALAADPLTPRTVASLKGTGASRDQIFRALQNLRLAGWAAQTADDAWRLTPRVTQLSEQVRLAIADTHRHYLGDLR